MKDNTAIPPWYRCVKLYSSQTATLIKNRADKLRFLTSSSALHLCVWLC